MKTSSLKYFKIFGAITCGTGILLHVSRAVFGADNFVKYILTPTNDILFSVPMILASVFAWAALKQIQFNRKWHKVAYILMSVYLLISLPVHIKSWFTNDMKQLAVFPEVYSLIILPVLLTLFLFTLSLKGKK